MLDRREEEKGAGALRQEVTLCLFMPLNATYSHFYCRLNVASLVAAVSHMLSVLETLPSLLSASASLQWSLQDREELLVLR